MFFVLSFNLIYFNYVAGYCDEDYGYSFGKMVKRNVQDHGLALDIANTAVALE